MHNFAGILWVVTKQPNQKMTKQVFDLLFAMAPAPQGDGSSPSFMTTAFPFIIMIALFYFVVLRPQSQARKAQEDLVAAVKTGDKAITTGGIVGIVANVKDKSVMLKVADNVKIEVLKSHLATVTKAGEDEKAAS